MKKKLLLYSAFFSMGGTQSSNRWRQIMEVPVTAVETMLRVVVPKLEGMEDDYRDLRFVINPSGTTSEKRFLDYGIREVESDLADEVVCYVGLRRPLTTSDSIYCLFDNPEAENVQSLRRAAQAGGWFYNAFESPGLWFDFHHALQGADVVLESNPDGEENHPAAQVDPISGKFLNAFKRDNENIHPGAETTRVVYQEYTPQADKSLVASAEEIVFNPEGTLGAGNAVLAVKEVNGQSLKVCFCNYQIAGGGGDQSEIRIHMSKKLGEGSWTDPVNLNAIVGLDTPTFGGTQGITTSNGWIWMATHCDVLPWTICIWYSKDDAVTWNYLLIPSPSGTVQLNETAIIQKRDLDGNPINEIFFVSRNEHDATRNPFYSGTITYSDVSVTASVPVIGPVADTTKNRPYLWEVNLPSGWRTFLFFGTTRAKGCFLDLKVDYFTGWNPIPYFINDGNLYGANRCYNVVWVGNDGEAYTQWADNKLAGGSDLYLQYFDAYLMQFRNLAITTLTDARPRPIYLNPGSQVGTLVAGYKTSSANNIAVPTTHPTVVVFNDVATGLSWQAGDTGVARRISAAYFQFTVVSYSGTTLTVSSTSHVGSGSGTTWTIDKVSNLQNDQSFASYFERNGRVRPVKVYADAESSDAVSCIAGFKLLEIRATSVITITQGGTGSITLKWQYTSGAYLGSTPILGIVGTFSGTGNIAYFVAGLQASLNDLDVCPAVTSDGTTITVKAPRGQASFINGLALTVEVTGDITASAGNFSGGSTEAPSTFSNNIVFNNTTVGIEQANDGYTAALAPGLNQRHTYEILWDGDEVTMVANGITRTKTAANGSGVPNWDGALFIFVSNTLANPQALLKSYRYFGIPGINITCTPEAATNGNYIENSAGTGLN